ncbi:MAG: hypothetical protein JWL77_2775 [Chthonomonadaceae bacterium]|nr:hypothetical protein [Chthonomonadaceae bacterium]
MQARQRTVGLGMLLALAAGMALAQQTPPAPAPLIHHTFETDPAEWMGLGTTAMVSVIHDADHVKEGKGALQFDYAANKGELNALLLPIPDGALTKMKSLHFWIRADYPTVFAVSLQEKDAGRYSAVFSAPGKTWQEVQLEPADFVLGEDTNDPKDPDGKLDLDQVNNIAIADYGQIFVQTDNADLQALFHIQKGPHTLNLDEFTVSAEPIAPAAPAEGKERMLDTPSRPQISWLGLGEVKVIRMTGKPLVGPGLRADYHQGPTKIMGLVKRIPRGRLKGMDQITFTAAATKSTKLVLQLEQVGGGKYRTIVDVPGSSEAKEFSLPFTGFEMTDDSGDRNGHFTPDQVNQIVILDASGIIDGADADNTLWINKLRTGPK